MCGNVGLISTSKNVTYWTNRKKWISDALIVDTIRGMDSTGLCAVRHMNLKEPEVYKQAVPGELFIQNKKVDDVLDHAEKFAVLMGHNRSATRGKVNTWNAHPFVSKHITMCHNGTLISRHGISAVPEVDSEAICEALSEKPATEVLSNLDGSFALQWYDAENLTYNIARNAERPLYFGFSKNKNMLFVASEWWIIKGLCMKNELPLYCNEIWSLTPGYLLSFDVTKDNFADYKKEKFDTSKKFKHVSLHGKGKQTTTTTQTTGTKSGTQFSATDLIEIGPNNSYAHQGALDKILELHPRKSAKYLEILTEISDEWQEFTLGERVVISDLNFTPYNAGVTDDLTNKYGRIDAILTIGDGSKYVWVESHNVLFSTNFIGRKSNEFICTITSAKIKSKSEYVVGVDAIDTFPVSKKDSRVEYGWLSVEEYLDEIAETSSVYEWPGPQDTMLTKEEFTSLVDYGCLCCTKPIICHTPADAEMLDWANDKPICAECWSANTTKYAEQEC